MAPFVHEIRVRYGEVDMQGVVFNEVPYIRVGNFNSVTARSAKLDGYVAMPWPFFWNTGLQK